MSIGAISSPAIPQQALNTHAAAQATQAAKPHPQAEGKSAATAQIQAAPKSPSAAGRIDVYA